MNSRYRYLFGPVPSRRFGRSLGVDLTPLKTCSFDCVFCQLGHTSHKTLDRRAYVPIADVRSELLHWREGGGAADYISLSGSGEPTLHTEFGDILTFIKKEFSIPAVLLSNSSLFWLAEVREAALSADIAKLSLSAWDSDSFRRINRPHPELEFDRCLEGLRSFRGAFRGKLWLEVFLVEGVNSSPDAVRKIAAVAETISPDEVHLNTVARPPAEKTVVAVSAAAMEEYAGLFRPRARVIAGFPTRCGEDVRANEDSILDLLRRRPCTSRQIADAFGMHINEVSKYTGDLVRARRIRTVWSGGEIYFGAVPPEHSGATAPERDAR